MGGRGERGGRGRGGKGRGVRGRGGVGGGGKCQTFHSSYTNKSKI